MDSTQLDLSADYDSRDDGSPSPSPMDNWEAPEEPQNPKPRMSPVREGRSSYSKGDPAESNGQPFVDIDSDVINDVNELRGQVEAMLLAQHRDVLALLDAWLPDVPVGPTSNFNEERDIERILSLDSLIQIDEQDDAALRRRSIVAVSRSSQEEERSLSHDGQDSMAFDTFSQ
ncbi:unnamed protein product, partial [Polarella glacialis]